MTIVSKWLIGILMYVFLHRCEAGMCCYLSFTEGEQRHREADSQHVCRSLECELGTYLFSPILVPFLMGQYFKLVTFQWGCHDASTTRVSGQFYLVADAFISRWLLPPWSETVPCFQEVHRNQTGKSCNKSSMPAHVI